MNFSLVLSLDGRKEVHDAMRPCVGGQGSYDKAVANFHKCLDSRKVGIMIIVGIYLPSWHLYQE